MDIEDLRLYFRSHIDPVVYEKRKESSEFIDQLLGFEISKIESNISKKKEYENWSHIGCSRFSTPYEECIEILTHLKLEPTARLVDVGAAYGRLSLIHI